VISFGLSEAQRFARDTVREFARRELRERARRCDEESVIPDELLERSWALGLVAACIPEELGGGGVAGGQTTSAIVLEELGYGCASLGAAIMGPMLFVRPLVDFGTEEQKRELLPLFTGSRYHAATLALHEPEFTFNPTSMRTTAERRGRGRVLRGEKRLVPMGDRASHFLIVARGEGGAGLANLEAFIVPRDAPGVRVHAERDQTIGFQAMPWGRLTLDSVEAPPAWKLGGEKGIDGRRLIAGMRVGGAALAVGLARAVLETCVPYAKERVAFGQPIAKKQAIAFMIADMHIEVDAMRWLVWKAASELEQGGEATRAAAIAQDYVARKAMKIADDGIQVFGGHGFIRDFPLEMWFRNARLLTVHEGPVGV
jgi:alkylation response protein AidB-like acyl-CoA dehydrogenase